MTPGARETVVVIETTEPLPDAVLSEAMGAAGAVMMENHGIGMESFEVDGRSLASRVGDFERDADGLTAHERSKLEDAAHVIAVAERSGAVRDAWSRDELEAFVADEVPVVPDEELADMDDDELARWVTTYIDPGRLEELLYGPEVGA